MDMFTSHPQTCRCRFHSQIQQFQVEARRHARYRELANAILGPDAPQDDRALVRAVAEHAKLMRSASNIAHIRDFRAA
jgi:hypothetical protein